MALPKLNTDLNYHQALSDRPNLNEGLTPTQVKQRYDQAPNDIKDYINNSLTTGIETQFATKTELNNAVVGQIPTTIAAPYAGTTTNSGNDYSVSTSLITMLLEGVSLKFKCNSDSTGATTLNCSGTGAKSILKTNGTAMATLKQNSIYTVVYNGTNFILQGEGGETSKYCNLFKNGSFEADTNCFTIVGSASVVSTAAKFGTKAMYQADTTANGSYLYQPGRFISGSKYYICGWCKNLTNATAYIDIQGTASTISFSTNTDFTFGSMIYTAPSTTTSNIRIGGCSATNNSAGIWVDGVMLIPLTNLFGAGNEPTKIDMDYLVNYYGGWWDSFLLTLTLDSTATAADVANGKIAYGGGSQIIGTNTNRKWASNTVTLAANGTTTITGLSFRPRLVTITGAVAGNATGAIVHMFDWTITAYTTANHYVRGLKNYWSSGTNYTWIETGNTYFDITNDGFKFQNEATSTVTFTWYAYE